MKTDKPIVYISGRYRARTIFGILLNILHARRAAQRLYNQGYYVICPHMNTAFFMGKPDMFISGCLETIKRLRRNTDMLYMLSNWKQSEGAKQEWALAKRRRLKIEYEKK